jgi:hypothetical protein
MNKRMSRADGCADRKMRRWMAYLLMAYLLDAASLAANLLAVDLLATNLLSAG